MEERIHYTKVSSGAMNPSIFIWLIYAFWLILIGYLIVSAIGVKPDSQRHLLQSFGLLLAIIVSFLKGVDSVRVVTGCAFSAAPCGARSCREPVSRSLGMVGGMMCGAGSVIACDGFVTLPNAALTHHMGSLGLD